ncbi:hypothetical protein GCM10020295_34390 [Streptomyces cinereospinus]
MSTVHRPPTAVVRPLRAVLGIVVTVLTATALAGCGGEGQQNTTTKERRGGAAPSPTASAAPSSSRPVGALPDAYDFTPAPERIPRTAAQARVLTRNASLTPADWSPGMVRHDPYELAGTWPVLPDTCVWTRAGLPEGVLDSYSRRIDLPAEDGKGRVQGIGDGHRAPRRRER